jgi:asparagine synthase (glutamine-hydrolysing)
MCGIAGTLDLRPGLPSSEEVVIAMTDLLLHRGPDDASVLVDHPVVLGHTRRAIFDLSDRGRQPMATPDGRYWVTYNGEVYNHYELADELRGLGHRFHTTCDTEVLLAAYVEWGEPALDRLNGDFAFVIWDRVRRELLCVRDRFGAKPIYYTVAGGRFRFASEIKSLLIDPEVPRRVNDARALDFLVHQLVDHTEETLFDGIKQVPAGALMRVTEQRGPLAPEIWYRPQPADLRGESPVDVIRTRLEEAVRLRLRSDVTLGVALSGGMDSSSVMGVAAKLLAEEGVAPPDSYSARCRDPRIDEGKWAAEVVRATGSRNFEVYPDDSDLLEHLDSLLWQMDEPFHSPTVYGHWKVFELADICGSVVVLEGQVGDDLFAGFHWLYPMTLYSYLRGGDVRGALSELTTRQRLHGVPVKTSLTDFAKLMLPGSLRGRSTPDWLRPGLAVPTKPLGGRTLRDQHLYSTGVFPTPGFLHHDDRNSLSLGVESRSPFLDHRLVEAALALRPQDLVRGGMNKWVLRQAMRGIVPDAVLDRPDKQGFSVDANDWFADGPLRQVVERAFTSPAMAARGYFDTGVLQRRLASHRPGMRADDLWRAFIVERWFQLFVDPSRLEQPPPLPRAPVARRRSGENVIRLTDQREQVGA